MPFDIELVRHKASSFHGLTRALALTATAALAACTSNALAPADDKAGGPAAPADSAMQQAPLAPREDPGAGIGRDPAVPPGSGLTFGEWPCQNGACDSSWGEVLTDLVQHTPGGNAGYDPYAVAFAQNATRIINDYLTAQLGRSQRAFYLLENRYVVVSSPDVRKAAAIPLVPSSLRGPLFHELVAGRPDLDGDPLFLTSEWVAHNNGAAVAIDRIEAGLWRAGQREALLGSLELTVYNLALAEAVQAHNPADFREGTQLWHLVAAETRRAMELYRRGRRLPDLASANQEAYERLLRTAPDALRLRRFVQRVYGPTWAREVLGVE